MRTPTPWLDAQITGDARFARHGVLLLDAATRQLPVTDPEIAAGSDATVHHVNTTARRKASTRCHHPGERERDH